MIHFKKDLTPRITPQIIIFDPTQYIGVIIMASVNIEQRKSKSGKITSKNIHLTLEVNKYQQAYYQQLKDKKHFTQAIGSTYVGLVR
jgi:hypothetical protein